MSKTISLIDAIVLPEEKELYTSDQANKDYRKRMGEYSKNRSSFDFIKLIHCWKDIVGEMLANNTVPLKIKNDTLLILTKHPIFAQELNHMSPLIISKIKEQFPNINSTLSKIKFLANESFFEKRENIQHEKEIKSQAPQLHRYSPEYIKRKQQALEMLEGIDEEFKEPLFNLFMQRS
jgi:hypothetical protein